MNRGRADDPPYVCLVWGKTFVSFVHPQNADDSQNVLAVICERLPAFDTLHETPLRKVVLKKKLQNYIWDNYTPHSRGSFNSSDAVRLHMKHEQHRFAHPKHEHSQLSMVQPSHAKQAAPMAASIDGPASECSKAI